jgi:hypothetical protein
MRAYAVAPERIRRVQFFGRKRGQTWGALLESNDFMLSLSSASRRLALLVIAAFASSTLLAESALVRQGVESPLSGPLPGDQVFGRAAVGPNGGYLVWQDNSIDGDGLGVGLRRLDRNLVPTFAAIRVNTLATGDQQNPQIALLKTGGAAVVWQGGPAGFPAVFARFLAADGTFAAPEVRVSDFATERQQQPQVTTLSDGNVAIVWTSLKQDGDLDGVFGCVLTPAGQRLGTGDFQVNQQTQLNQRCPAVAALPGGKLVVVWVSEKPNRVGTPAPSVEPDAVAVTGADRMPPPFDVSVYGRIFDANGPITGEFKVNSTTFVCANPAVTANADGGFFVAWSSRVGRVAIGDVVSLHGYDIAGRAFNADATPAGDETILNERTFGDQFLPAVAAVGTDYFTVWTSLGQDGSREGVIGRVFNSAGTPTEPEFIVNSTVVGPQQLPAVTADGTGRAFVLWSATAGGVASFDIVGQRFTTSNQLRAPDKPIVSALSASRLCVAWPDLAPIGAASYELYLDGAATPLALTQHFYTAASLQPASTHSFRLVYVNQTGQKSPLSDPATGKTWGPDENFDGLPDDWQSKFWGTDPALWPAPGTDSDSDGASNLQEFLAGTSPTDPGKVLRMGWRRTPDRKVFLTWNAERGVIYQVQVSYDSKKWTNLGAPRFAASSTDEFPADSGAPNAKAIYRILRVR